MKDKDEYKSVLLPIIREVLPDIMAKDVLGLTAEDVIRVEVEKIENERKSSSSK